MRLIYQDVARDGNGLILSGAEVSVTLADTSASATIYSTLTGTTPAGTVTSGSDGTFSFYVDASDYGTDQAYNLSITYDTFSSGTISNIKPIPVLGSYSITSAKTYAKHVEIPRGVTFIRGGGGSLSFTGQFTCGTYQIFSGFSSGQVTFTSSIEEVFPEWWGAVADGSTDGSSAINNAIGSIAAIRGTVSFGPGTYICNCTMQSNVRLVGSGIEKTILKSKSSSGLDVIKGANFDTLTGTAKAVPETRGVNFYEIHDMTIDGNRANNTAGYGIRIWGKAPIWTNVIVRNCANDGIWTEFTTIDVPAAPNEYLQALEGRFTNIKTIGNGGNGWTFRGPHDSQLVYFDTFENDGWGYESASSAGGYTGGMGASAFWNSWNNTLGSYHFGASTAVSGIIASGPGTGIDMGATVGNCHLSNAFISGNTGTAGLIMRGSEHVISGSFDSNTGDAIQIDGATGYILNVTGSSNGGNFLNFINDGGGTVNAFADIPALAATYTGTIVNATTANITGIGAGTLSRITKLQSASIMNADGYSHTVPDNNYVFAVTNSTATPASATAGASPWVYQNVLGFDIDIAISGGTVSKIEFSRDGSTYFDMGITSGVLMLSQNDYVKITHTGAPTYTLIAR